jgi:hypothetical protein
MAEQRGACQDCPGASPRFEGEADGRGRENGNNGTGEPQGVTRVASPREVGVTMVKGSFEAVLSTASGSRFGGFHGHANTPELWRDGDSVPSRLDKLGNQCASCVDC